jgi:hypothetical protein
MAEVCYTARAIMKQQVIKGIGKLTLHTNEHRQYMHKSILLLQKGIRCMLVSRFSPSNPGKGMAKLLEDGSNLLTNVKSTKAITAYSVLKAAKTKADGEFEGSINNDCTHHHLTIGGTIGSRPFECDQPIGHQRKGKRSQGHDKIGWQ